MGEGKTLDLIIVDFEASGNGLPRLAVSPVNLGGGSMGFDVTCESATKFYEELKRRGIVTGENVNDYTLVHYDGSDEKAVARNACCTGKGCNTPLDWDKITGCEDNVKAVMNLLGRQGNSDHHVLIIDSGLTREAPTRCILEGLQRKGVYATINCPFNKPEYIR